MLNTKKIAIIGAGNMGSVLATACARIFPDFEIVVSDHNRQKIRTLSSKSKISAAKNNLDAVTGAYLIIIAVKPQSFFELAQEIKGKIDARSIVVSIMAGVKIQKIQNALRIKKVVRAMPNMAASINKSVSVWVAHKSATMADKKIIARLFGGIGIEAQAESEKLIDAATALSGSGPGFIFYLVEEWMRAGKNLGFDQDDLKKIIIGTLDGANALLQQGADPVVLKKRVASKGGTTEAGLSEMEKYADKMWRETLGAAFDRAVELSS